MRTTSVQDQITSSVIDNINTMRIESELHQLGLQDASFVKSMEYVDHVREFIGDPSKILGSDATKHGEIAEQVEVGIRNARDVLLNRTPTASFEGVGRTAPADYLIDGMQVQSKFINGLNNNLEHVLKHMDKYENFGRDGSFYHIPKDSYELIKKIHNNEDVAGLSTKTIESIKNKINEIELKTGQPFTKVVQPAISNYDEVQQGRVVDTLNKHEEDLTNQNENIKDTIRNDHKATFNEGLKAAGAAATVGGALALGSSLYLKYKKEGKNPFHGDLTADDWKEIGLTTAKGAAVAGVTGAAVYALTNCAGLAAPFAGAFVTATKGVSSLVRDFHGGIISFEEFQMNAIFLCADSAGVGLATVMGQSLIPIPVVGAVIGSLAGKFVCNVLLGEDKELAQKMEMSMQKLINQLDDAYKQVVDKINQEFDQIADLRQKAFDVKSNIDLIESSIALARAYGVDESKILKDEDDLYNFLFN